MIHQLLEPFTDYPIPTDPPSYGEYQIDNDKHPDDGRTITAIKYHMDDDTAWAYYNTNDFAVAMQQAIDDYTNTMNNEVAHLGGNLTMITPRSELIIVLIILPLMIVPTQWIMIQICDIYKK